MRAAYAVAGVALVLALSVFPVRILLGEWRYRAAERILDDPATGTLDLVDLSDATFGTYREALRLIAAARAAQPGNVRYGRAAVELHAKLDAWKTTMALLDAPYAGDGHAAGDDRQLALRGIQDMIGYDPLNAHLHIAQGILQARAENPAAAAASLERAAQLYPVNAEVRRIVSQQYLIMHEERSAIEHARLLARYDDSYRTDDEHTLAQYHEQRPAAYEDRLRHSNLFLAYEIAWRASHGDRSLLEEMTPADEEAREVLAVFFNMRGVGERGPGQAGAKSSDVRRP